MWSACSCPAGSRSYGSSRAIGDLALSFTSVFVERMIGISTLLLIVLIGLIAGPPGLSPALGYWAVLGLALLVLGAGVLMSQLLRDMTGRLMTGRLLRPIWTRIVKLYGHLDAYALQPKLLGWSMVLAVTIHAVRIVYTTAAAWALGIDVALVTLIVLVPIVFFVAQLPISVGGLGVREMTFVSLLGRRGRHRRRVHLVLAAVCDAHSLLSAGGVILSRNTGSLSGDDFFGRAK